MIWLWPKHRPGQAQFVYFYQHAYPHLRTGDYVANLARLVAKAA